MLLYLHDICLLIKLVNFIKEQKSITSTPRECRSYYVSGKQNRLTTQDAPNKQHRKRKLRKLIFLLIYNIIHYHFQLKKIKSAPIYSIFETYGTKGIVFKK